MSRTNAPANGAAHVLAGVAAAGLSHAVVPVRHSGDFVVRALVGAALSLVVLALLSAA